MGAARDDETVAQAMTRVLAAERDAVAAVARARSDAQARVDAARDAARALVEATAARIAERQQRHEQALRQRVRHLEAQAAERPAATPAPEGPALAAAVARVAAVLSGGHAAD